MSRPDDPGMDLQVQIEDLLKLRAPREFAPHVGGEVLDRLDRWLGRYVAYPDEHMRHAHTLWIAHCWLVDCWYTTPRLVFISPEAGSGKTRALTMTAHLVPYPDLTADLTPAYLYHSIDRQIEQTGHRPTMLYDELDTVFGSGSRYERMRRLIDAGHARGATVNRLMGKRGAVRFPIYCAMAMAGKMDIYDIPPTIATRSVVVRMQRRAPEETIDRWDRRDGPAEAVVLRDLVEYWAEFVHEDAFEYIPEMPDEIRDRDADVWEPLIAVADMAGGDWPKMARVAAVAAVAAIGARSTPSQGMQLLWDIKRVFDRRRVDVMFTTRLISELRSLEDSQWSGLAARTPNGAGMVMRKLLSGYNIAPTDLRIGERTGHGYRRTDFAEAWRRYPPPPVAATAATAATNGGEPNVR